MQPADAAPPRGSLPRYRRALDVSWVLGDFPVRELLRHAPDAASEVRWHGDLDAERRARLAAACERSGVPFRRDDAAVVEKRSKGTARVLATFRKVERPLAQDRDRLVLVTPREPGNLGTMLRSALAFGVEDVAVIGEADPWSPHVARASLGSLFALRIARFATLEEHTAHAPDHDRWWLDARGGVPLHEAVTPSRPVALIAGPEWPGLDPAGTRIGTTVRIDLDARVESLNVGVAVGIALHRLNELRSRR